MKFFLTLALIFIVNSSIAAPHGISAKRPLHLDWKTMVNSMRPAGHKTYGNETAVDKAVGLPLIDTNQVIKWKDYATVEAQFKQIRDIKFIAEAPKKKMRRSTWLYPDDGCYARASLMNKNIEKSGLPMPQKIFVFGDLLVNTDNAVGGSVSWWYHVAPIVSDGTDVYVLDPAIEPKNPLKLKDWLWTMGDPDSLRISICESASYTPYSACKDVDVNEDSSALDDQMFFLSLERYRLEELGRDADEELGEHPPWLVQ